MPCRTSLYDKSLSLQLTSKCCTFGPNVQALENKNKQPLSYKLWQKHSKKNVGNVGDEETSTSTAWEHKDMKSLGLRKFRHIHGSDMHKAKERLKQERKKHRNLQKVSIIFLIQSLKYFIFSRTN